MKVVVVMSLVCLTNAYHNIVFGNFGASPKMIKKLGNIHEDSIVLESDIEMLTTITGWQLKWDEHNYMEFPEKIDTIHCLSGGVINMMLFLDANKHVVCDKLILESPVFPSVDMLIIFDKQFKDQNSDKTVLLRRLNQEVCDSEHYFSAKLLTPFSETKLDEVRYFINELVTGRFSEVLVIACDDDILFDDSHIQSLLASTERCNLPSRLVNVKSRHAMFSVMNSVKFNDIVHNNSI